MGWTTLGKHNPRLSQLRRVAQGRDAHRTLVEGPKMVRDLLRLGLLPEAVYANDVAAASLEGDPELSPLVERALSFRVPAATLARLAPTQHGQGLLAVFPVPRWDRPRGDIIVYLDRVQDPANVGAIVRVAAGLGAGSVVCSPGCANPFSPKAVRASAGASLCFPVLKEVPFADLTRWLPASRSVVAAVPEGGTPLPRFRPRTPLVLVLGNEGQGLAPELVPVTTERVTVPLARGVESLNVAVACGVLLACITGACHGPYTE